jgi:hypothetical protein
MSPHYWAPEYFSDFLVYLLLVIIGLAVFHLGNKIVKYNSIESKDENGNIIKPKNKALFQDIIFETIFFTAAGIVVAILLYCLS